MEFYLLQACDLCGNDYPIHKAFHDYEQETWIEFNGKQFLCNRCRNEKKVKDLLKDGYVYVA